jgi:hypothetical protein
VILHILILIKLLNNELVGIGVIGQWWDHKIPVDLNK